MKEPVKICFAASSGGHYEQLLRLKPLMETYQSFIVTEKTSYQATTENSQGFQTYYLWQINRKEKVFLPKMLVNAAHTLKILLEERPTVVICTGVLATIPLCVLAKMSGAKLIYIESFAKITSATETGKMMYKLADRFYVQWESMLEIYPNALFLGSIY